MKKEYGAALRADLDQCMPHRPPMRLLDSLTRVAPGEAEALLRIRPDNLFLTPDGPLERAAFLEIMAQCFAAGSGALRPESGPKWGYLAGVRNLSIESDAHVGDELRVKVWAVAELGGVTVVEGEVFRNDDVLAHGQFKVYVPPAAEA